MTGIGVISVGLIYLVKAEISFTKRSKEEKKCADVRKHYELLNGSCAIKMHSSTELEWIMEEFQLQVLIQRQVIIGSTFVERPQVLLKRKSLSYPVVLRTSFLVFPLLKPARPIIDRARCKGNVLQITINNAISKKTLYLTAYS